MTVPIPGQRVRALAPRRTLLGVFLAIAITSAMDATGLSAFSALPLLPLMAIFWALDRFPRQSMGFVLGRWRHYGLAVLYPVLVLGLITLISAAAGAVDLSQTDWKKAWLHCALIAASTTLVAMVTEEGFFRGWLWASLERSGRNQKSVLVWSSIAFSLWHLSAVALKTGFDPPAAQVPVFMINVAVIGAAWGLMRSVSRSLVVTSVSHGVWNGIAYVFFGFGTKVGALGIKETALYGPEVGVLGLVLNVFFVAVLWRWSKVRSTELPSPV